MRLLRRHSLAILAPLVIAAGLLTGLSKHGDAGVLILHGDNDESIPVTMSRDLAKEFPNPVRYTEIPGGRHNTLQDIAAGEIRAAMASAPK
jgi:pimeloyl-ACP methyl ester carboxylesterase